MDITDKRYSNQGLHVVLSLFTVEKGKFKVLLIKRNNEPFKDKWTLVGGCAYNTEDADTAMNRELYEKTHIKNIDFKMINVFTDPKRSPLMRMIAISYMGVSDARIIEKFKTSSKASDADWFEIDRVPELAYGRPFRSWDAMCAYRAGHRPRPFPRWSRVSGADSAPHKRCRKAQPAAWR